MPPSQPLTGSRVTNASAARLRHCRAWTASNGSKRPVCTSSATALPAVVGTGRIVGLSTHSIAQAAAAARSGADYIAVGPVHATPTKEGRPPIGLEPVRHAAAHVGVPWFAIGGIDAGNVDEVVAAGAARIVVVRAIAEAADPERAARALREAVSVGAAQ